MEIRLEELGYGGFFASGFEELGLNGCMPARVISEHKGAYGVRDARGEYLATVTGKQIYGARGREDYPAVGDWVALGNIEGGRAVIQGLLPRRTLLKRKCSGGSGAQVIAANVDTAFVVESAGGNFSPNRAERYVAIAREGGIRPVIVLNKIDLVPQEEAQAMVSSLKKRFNGIEVIGTSAVSDGGLEEMEAFVLRGETCCLLGPSGVGKSTLINRLLGEDAIKTGEISGHTGKGKHTTTARHMHFLPDRGMLIDNPGMREVGMTDARAGLDDTFVEITALAGRCRFADCTHVHEPGCAVREAVVRGELTGGRFDNYLKLSREAEYYKMTSLEKRRKDRDFGRFVKTAKKDLKKHDYR